jgi:hypothetical protein
VGPDLRDFEAFLYGVVVRLNFGCVMRRGSDVRKREQEVGPRLDDRAEASGMPWAGAGGGGKVGSTNSDKHERRYAAELIESEGRYVGGSVGVDGVVVCVAPFVIAASSAPPLAQHR